MVRHLLLAATIAFVLLCLPIGTSASQQHHHQHHRHHGQHPHDHQSYPDAPSQSPLSSAAWLSFRSQFNVSYASLEEEQARFHIFDTNRRFIEETNQRQSSYKLAINQFADLTFAEFRALMGKKSPSSSSPQPAASNLPHPKKDLSHEIERDSSLSRKFLRVFQNVTTPATSIDWRTKNAVTPIKNQQGCGCDYAFASVAAIESAHAIKTGTLITLSEQQIVDCSEPQGNQGCEGGGVDNSYRFAVSNKGLATEVNYPYNGEAGVCVTPPLVATISSFVDVTAGDESALVNAININPVAVYVDSSNAAWQFYSMGILNDPTCGTAVDHAVVVVGYGQDPKTQAPYYIVKNSWGPIWGEQGFAQLARNVNQCGISTRMSYPVV